ncbi:hypothetical protein BGP_2315 [Beggiatoa sp. PS]|nr:hypothetical protein BGP_2315 [Beggiatoa sp. PS]
MSVIIFIYVPLNVFVLADKLDYLLFFPPRSPIHSVHHLKLHKRGEIPLFSVLFCSDFQILVSGSLEHEDFLCVLVISS